MLSVTIQEFIVMFICLGLFRGNAYASRYKDTKQNSFLRLNRESLENQHSNSYKNKCLFLNDLLGENINV